MNSDPLNESELEFVNDILMKYGNDDSILDVSELDGFLTALVSGPDVILLSRWFPEVWGGAGNQPEWEDEAEIQQFMGLLMQHMNNNAAMLTQYPDDFEALFNIRNHDEDAATIVEEWCFGYMRGLTLAEWPDLPENMEACLKAISLHGMEETFDELARLSIEERQQTVTEIEPAARKLHKYWLLERTKPVSVAKKNGRNDPCPCGSGKKYKQCCLQ